MRSAFQNRPNKSGKIFMEIFNAAGVLQALYVYGLCQSWKVKLLGSILIVLGSLKLYQSSFKNMENLTPGDTEGQTIVQEEATGKISEGSSDKLSEENLQDQGHGESVSGGFADPAETEKDDLKELERDEHLNVNKVDMEESKEGENNVEDIEKEKEEPVAMLDEAEGENETELSNNEQQTAVTTEPETEEAKEEDAWLDILGNGLLKKKVHYLVRVLFYLLPWSKFNTYSTNLLLYIATPSVFH